MMVNRMRTSKQTGLEDRSRSDVKRSSASVVRAPTQRTRRHSFPYSAVLRQAANRSAPRPCDEFEYSTEHSPPREQHAPRQDAPRRALLAHAATRECYDALQKQRA